MSNLGQWLEIVTDNHIQACNKVTSRNLSLCFNFIQIPDTDTIVMTIAIMKNRVKRNSMEPSRFATLMRSIENCLMEVGWEYSGYSDYFTNVTSRIDKNWYIKMCCHRIFFLPNEYLLDTLGALFTVTRVAGMRQLGIDEVAVYVSTDEYDFNGKVY